MKTFSVIYLATCIAFADALFPYSALAIGAWLTIALATLAIQRKIAN